MSALTASQVQAPQTTVYAELTAMGHTMLFKDIGRLHWVAVHDGRLAEGAIVNDPQFRPTRLVTWAVLPQAAAA